MVEKRREGVKTPSSDFAYPPQYWLKLGLVSGEQLLCSHCGKPIEGANDAEHGLVYLLVIPPLPEVEKLLCETCFETGKNKNRRNLGNVEREREE